MVFRARRLLCNLNLEVSEGEFISVWAILVREITLLKLIGMREEPSGVDCYFLDKPVHQLKEKERTQLHKSFGGLVFQSYHLIDELTVYENIETPLLYQHVKSADHLHQVNFVGKKNLFPTQLAGGQQLLVGIARAVAASPKLILANEPTGYRNSQQGEEIKLLNQEGTIMIPFNPSGKIATCGSRVIVLPAGSVAQKNF